MLLISIDVIDKDILWVMETFMFTIRDQSFPIKGGINKNDCHWGGISKMQQSRGGGDLVKFIVTTKIHPPPPPPPFPRD